MSLALDQIIEGDCRTVLGLIDSHSIDLSFWSPPYHVGKSYERGDTFEDWQALVSSVIKAHQRILKPGGFLAINIGDILCFPDPDMPSYSANSVRGKSHTVTHADVLKMQRSSPEANRYELARRLGCSEQTVQRRLEGNNSRGGKHGISTKVVLTGCMVEKWATEAGLYLYDQRIWHKDPCWINSRWHANSYRAVDEFEHIYVFWVPGVVQYDRHRLTKNEWSDWGSRGVWQIGSVRRHDRHEAEFPEELARRVIKLFSPIGGTVFDPFVGSGTTTTVAKALRRRWLGIEMNSCYVKGARSRVDAVNL